jgi:hypothetical protein
LLPVPDLWRITFIAFFSRLPKLSKVHNNSWNYVYQWHLDDQQRAVVVLNLTGNI